MQLQIFLFFAAFSVPAFAHPPKPSAYPPPPPKFPPGKTCPTVLVCCDSFKSPYESDAWSLIDLLKVELSVAEKSLGVGLTCDAIVGLEKEKAKAKAKKRHNFHFGNLGHVDGDSDDDSDSDSDSDSDNDSDGDDDHDEHDSYAKLAKRGVDVCAKVSLCCDKSYGSGLLAIGCIEVSLD